MVRALVLYVGLLGLPGDDPPPGGKAAAAETAQARALAEYNGLREKTPETAAAQWGLASWCEKHGLQAEMRAHLASVVRLDPTREAAWKKLGFKKVRGQWMNEDELAREADQQKADKLWAPRLKNVHKVIHNQGGKRQAEAQESLDSIDDPKAVRPVYQEFGRGGELDQLIAVQILGHIDSPLSSKVLASMSVYGKTAEVRRRAIETLRGGRNAEDYLDILVALLTDPVKFEVRPVRGPGSPGAIFVEGQRFNVQRVYAAPAPNLTPQPGDLISYDDSGMPVIDRPNGLFWSNVASPGSRIANERVVSTTRINVANALSEANRAATSSQQQLAADVENLEELNDQRKQFNELVINAAKHATGKNHGDDLDAWRKAVGDRLAYKKPSDKPRPTYNELVPPAYQPTFARLSSIMFPHIAPPG